MTDANRAWGALSTEMKLEYKQKAESEEKPDFLSMPVEWQHKKIKSIRNKITDLVTF